MSKPSLSSPRVLAVHRKAKIPTKQPHLWIKDTKTGEAGRVAIRASELFITKIHTFMLKRNES